MNPLPSALHTRAWVPQFPHALGVPCVLGMQTWILHSPVQSQLELQVCKPDCPAGHARVIPGVHAVSLQVPKLPQVPLREQTRVRVPSLQLPQRWVWDSPGVHSEVQLPVHWQLFEQVRPPVWPAGHDSVAPGLQTPSPVQGPKAEYWPVVPLHVRVRVPQLPQPSLEGPSQVWPVHAGSQRQLLPQVCVPSMPQLRVMVGVHSPSRRQADQADHWPVSVSHVRVWLPQLPQIWVVGPAQL